MLRRLRLLSALCLLGTLQGCGALAAEGVNALINQIDQGGGGGSSGPKMSADETSMANQLLALVNAERIGASLTPLLSDSKLVSAALGQAIDMDTRNFFDHVNPDGHDAAWRIGHAGVSFSSSGEDIAMGEQTAADAMAVWMASDPDKANILNPNFTKIGVAVHIGVDGPFWVMDFVTP
jgi:uncharacterized protein YkwD